MLGTCPICLEALTAKVEPATMPCGHLYCLACASFWFHQGDAPQPCVICRRTFRGGDIIKLWLTTADSSQRSQAPAAPGSTQASGAAQEALDACEAAKSHAAAEDGDAALATALSKTEAFADGVEGLGQHEAGVMNVVKGIRTALSDIKSLLEKKAAAHASAHTLHPPVTHETEISRLRAKFDRDIQELYRESVLAEEADMRAQDECKAREEDLRQRLYEVRRRLENNRHSLHEKDAQIASLTEELARTRKSEVRYKKKYYALKQDVLASRQGSRRSPTAEDDSLVII